MALTNTQQHAVDVLEEIGRPQQAQEARQAFESGRPYLTTARLPQRAKRAVLQANFWTDMRNKNDAR